MDELMTKMVKLGVEVNSNTALEIARIWYNSQILKCVTFVIVVIIVTMAFMVFSNVTK